MKLDYEAARLQLQYSTKIPHGVHPLRWAAICTHVANDHGGRGTNFGRHCLKASKQAKKGLGV